MQKIDKLTTNELTTDYRNQMEISLIFKFSTAFYIHIFYIVSTEPKLKLVTNIATNRCKQIENILKYSLSFDKSSRSI